MEYREYGRTGIKLSSVGFGTLRIPRIKNDADAALYVNLLQEAMDLGINYFDTAAMQHYGSESVLGAAMKGRRESVYVATKNHFKDGVASEWERLLEESLANLGTDYIDFYHLHNIHWDAYHKKLVPGGVMDSFRRARDEGKVRHICFSSHDTPANIERLIDTGEFEGILVQYNMLDRRNEDVIRYAHKKGLGVAIMGSVGGGRLTSPVERLQDAADGDLTMPELALRFVVSNPNVTVALAGINTAAVLHSCVKVGNMAESLTDSEITKIEAILHELQGLKDAYRTGCGYCMPCPNGVDIPGNFESMSYHKVWGLTGLAKREYRKRKKNTKRTWAEACVGCGICEPNCPQGIPIRNQLRETASVLGATK
jgi:predicted aldo/keto reductase-like oxidoreductase